MAPGVPASAPTDQRMRKMTATPDRLETEPLHPAFGVTIANVDLSAMLADREAGAATFARLRDAFERHSVLLLPDQTLTPEEHLAFARLWGPIEDREADTRAKGEAFAIPQVSNRRAEGGVVAPDALHSLNLQANQLWHTDSTFLPTPALANILIARTVPSEGGETELASTRAAWAAMPEDLKTELRDTVFWHRYAHSRAQISPELARLPMFSRWADRPWRAVWTNPVTGEEALYIASHAFRVEGLSDAEAATLIGDLIAFATAPAYVYTHRWRPGDVMVFDERATLHRGRPWPLQEERTLSSLCVSAGPDDGLASIRPPARVADA